jgi:hypothetical protein
VATWICPFRSAVRDVAASPCLLLRMHSWQQAGAPAATIRDFENEKGSGSFAASGANLWGWALVTRSFPAAHAWTRSHFAGGVLPDATLRGMRMSRSHGGTVLIVADRDLSSEASAPSSDTPCRERRAGRGADTPAISVSRRHLYRGVGISLWPIVGPSLRV